MRKIYKYVGSSYLNQVFPNEATVTLKCSRPRDFNDPYELFLTIDCTAGPDALAFYAETIGVLPQVPTTCFSRSPIVIPMWAHYAENLGGVVIEFDESNLAAAFPGSGFGDVDYRDSPDPDLGDLLDRARVIKKPRYVHMLQQSVFSAAYYTKATCWNYEQERRMLVHEEQTRHVDDLLLVDVPKDCVTAVISGPRAASHTSEMARGRARLLGCPYFELRIGRSSTVPFLLDARGESWSFTGAAINRAESPCDSCGEPATTGGDHCSWCQITEANAEDAAQGNPFRILARHGLLDSYVSRMNEIAGRARKTGSSGHGGGSD